MGFGLHKKVRGTGFGNAITPIDKKISGTDGTKGMVGKRVKPIDRKTKNIFDPLS